MFYTMNSIPISAASRTKQYGVMRAVGMDAGGLTRYFGMAWHMPWAILCAAAVFVMACAAAAIYAPAKMIRSMAIIDTISEP